MDFLLNKKVLLYWRFTAAVLFTAAFSAFNIVFSLRLFWVVVAAGGYFLLLGVTMFWYLPKCFSATSLTVKNGMIILKRGVIIKHEYIFPNARTVYLQNFKPLLAACFGLRYSVVRGVGYSLNLPPMTELEAERFKKAVQKIEP